MTVLVKVLNDFMIFFEFIHFTDELSHQYSNIYTYQLSLCYVMKTVSTYQHLYLKVLTAFNLMSIFSIVHTQNQLRAKI